LLTAATGQNSKRTTSNDRSNRANANRKTYRQTLKKTDHGKLILTKHADGWLKCYEQKAKKYAFWWMQALQKWKKVPA
jgi:hypothetical protein